MTGPFIKSPPESIAASESTLEQLFFLLIDIRRTEAEVLAILSGGGVSTNLTQ